MQVQVPPVPPVPPEPPVPRVRVRVRVPGVQPPALKVQPPQPQLVAARKTLRPRPHEPLVPEVLLPELTAQKVETGGSTSLSVQELRGMVPKAKGATKIALQASLLSCGTVHQLKDVLRAEGLPKCHSSKKLEVSNVLREHWGMRRW